jgi:biopolymer transport protein ExbD
MAAAGRLSAAQRGKIRRLSRPHELSPDEEGGELNIVPFLDIVVNILIFVLATVAVTFTTSIETSPPAASSSGVRSTSQDKALGLTVLIVDDGFSLKAAGGNVAPGCQGPGPGLAIPNRGAAHDFTGLTACAARLKRSSPDFSAETQVFLGANPGTDYQTLISTIDALRVAADGSTLFPDVNFKVAQ